MIADAIRLAQTAHRQVIEQTYTGLFSATKHEDIKDPETRLCKKQEVRVCEDVPCKLAFEGNTPVAMSGGAPQVTQSIKLFTAPELAIIPGSKITVTQDGVTTEYKGSGKPAVYPTHQEITLELFKGWA